MVKRLFFLLLFYFTNACAYTQALFEMPNNVDSRLSSFENINGVKGNGGKTNRTAKGNAFEVIQPGAFKNMLDIKGEGSIRRIWLTIDQTPVKLRSCRLQMFWDGATKPAVDVPLGDFFGYNLGKPVAFQSALFSSGEGRSFVCYIPMPFKASAKILLTNEGKEPVKLFFDVDFLFEKLPPQSLYFHAYWQRKWNGQLGDDLELLPKINGRGRFLGISAGLITDSVYGKSWWGEGEFKAFIDGDTKYPTIAGTGAEDYIGSAWGLGTFINTYQGCTIANDSAGLYNFYRWHIPDPIWFNKNLRVTLQQIGGWGRNDLKPLFRRGVHLKPVTIDGPAGFVRLLDETNPPSLLDERFPDGWVNFYRIDDYTTTSYFYLDRPKNNLPALPGLDVRLRKLN